VKQNVAWPAVFVVEAPLDGLAWVARDAGTLKTTVTFGTGFPNVSVTVAVTQCFVPTTTS
jgi:hypothetical protein